MKNADSYMLNLFCTCLLLVSLTMLSCKKFVTIDAPPDKVPAATVFHSDETADAAVLGLYTQMMPASLVFSSGAMTVYGGLSAEELQPTSTSSSPREFFQNRLQAGNSVVRLNFWLRLYQTIYASNACMEGLQASATLTPSYKERLLGEAKMVRAFCYFYLVNLFGDVPLVTSTGYRSNATMPRTAAAQVWGQIATDLKEAKEALPAAYPPQGRTRPNKWAAAALLARVHLYQGAWAEAEAEAGAVIASGMYSLAPDLNTVFLAGSEEAIWQLAPVEEGFNTTEARFLIPAPLPSSRPLYPLTAHLLAAFETGDKRKEAWVGAKTVGSLTYAYPYKYKVSDYGLPVTEHYTVLRYAEQLLIRAEARAQQAKLPDATGDVDAVRARAGLPATTAQDGVSLLAAILQERRFELFAEWGHRWLDLKRTGQVQPVMTAVKPTWQSTGVLFPIPLGEIEQNPFLTQNPGY